MGKLELIQSTTKKIVDLIKVLLEHANANDLTSVTSASNMIYYETQDMVNAILLKV